jgi:hypothetical protein
VPENTGKGNNGGHRSAAKHTGKAFGAACDAAPGKSRYEVKDLYVAELRAHGQEIPSEPILEADIDLLAGHPLRGLGRLWNVMRNRFGDP